MMDFLANIIECLLYFKTYALKLQNECARVCCRQAHSYFLMLFVCIFHDYFLLSGHTFFCCCFMELGVFHQWKIKITWNNNIT